MCPRVDVFALESNKNINEIIDELISNGFSRVPVYEDNLDKVIGVCMSDLLIHLEKDDFNWNVIKKAITYSWK